MKRLTILWALLAIPAPIEAGTAPDEARTAIIEEIVEGAHMRTARGTDLILASVEMPPVLANATAGERRYADRARQALANLVLEREVRWIPVGKRPDRHGRQPVDIRIDGRSVGMTLLSQGWAYVSPNIRPPKATASFYAAEQQARRQGRGMWGSKHLTPTEHRHAGRRIGRFAVIAGTVRRVRRIGSITYLNFGSDWRQDFTILIRSRSRRAFAGCDPQRLAQRHVHVRGWVQSYNGPLIEVYHPQQIDTLTPPAPTDAPACPDWSILPNDPPPDRSP